MKKILIATRNRDKFKIVKKLLATGGFENYEFYSLSDIDENFQDKKEIGDIINRSFEKAKNVYENIENNYFEYIVGIDDGIKIRGKIIEDVKKYINSIIDDEYLKENEIVYIVRAYTFFNLKGDNYSIITEIPFEYHKLSYKFNIEEGSYPLSHVLSSLGSNEAIIKQTDEESNSYYLEYSKDKFIEILNYFNDK